jgi:hypothetical protein
MSCNVAFITKDDAGLITPANSEITEHAQTSNGQLEGHQVQLNGLEGHR